MMSNRANPTSRTPRGIHGNPVEIRCQFVFSGKNDELTPDFWLSSLIHNAFLSCRGNGVINEAGCWDYLVGMTSGAIHVAQVPESGWPCPLPPPLGCNLSTNRKRKPKWRRCVAASIAVGPSAILTGSQTRPSDWGSNARFGPVEDRRNNRRLAPFTCTPCVLQI